MSTHFKMVIFLSLGLILAFGLHFATVLGWFGSAPETRAGFFIRIALMFIGFVFISAITASWMARKAGDAEVVLPDEREEILELKAERAGSIIVYLGLLFVAWFAFMPLAPMQIANSILAVVCIAELVKIVYGVVILKRSF